MHNEKEGPKIEIIKINLNDMSYYFQYEGEQSNECIEGSNICQSHPIIHVVTMITILYAIE